MARYGKSDYWDHRYTNDREPYEWYADYDSLQHLLTPENLSSQPFPTREECRVLILGCGNSRLGEDLLHDGWGSRIVNVDYSSVVIEQMKERYNDDFYDPLKPPFNKKVPGGMRALESIPESWEDRNPVSPDEPTVRMEFLCADMTEKLPFEDGSFDLIIIKGTFEAVLCSAGSKASIKQVMHECFRLLDRHGAMVVVTIGTPDNRLVFFENDGNEWWEKVGVHKVTHGPKDTYVYIGQKRNAQLEQSAEICESDQALEKSSSNEENDASIVQKVSAQVDANSAASVSGETTLKNQAVKSNAGVTRDDAATTTSVVRSLR